MLVAQDNKVHSSVDIKPRAHNRLLLPMLDQALVAMGVAKADLDYLAVGLGPGSFVGVRMGAALIKGLGLALDIPVAGFSSMQAQAASISRRGGCSRVHMLMDARMGDVYSGVYQRDGKQGFAVLEAEQVIKAQAVVPDQQARLAGDMAAQVAQANGLPARRVWDGPQYPDLEHSLGFIRDHIASGMAVPAEQLLPRYLKGGSWKKKHQQ